MSLYDKKYKNDATAESSSRSDNKTGTFWLKLDDLKEEKSADGLDYAKSYFTTVFVVDGDGDQEVGDETTMAHFHSQKHNFFERDMKKLLQMTKNMTSEEIKALPMFNSEAPKAPSVLRSLFGKHVAKNVTFEFKCKVRVKQDSEDGDTYTQIAWDKARRVAKAELEAKLTKKQIKSFFPEGIPEDPEGLMVGDVSAPETTEEKPAKKPAKKPAPTEYEADDEDEKPAKKAKKPAESDDDDE